MTSRVLLDPTSERSPDMRPQADRPESLKGITVGLLDIGKVQSTIFLDEVEAQLKTRGLAVERFRKSTFARPAPLGLRQEIASRCNVVIEALAD